MVNCWHKFYFYLLLNHNLIPSVSSFFYLDNIELVILFQGRKIDHLSSPSLNNLKPQLSYSAKLLLFMRLKIQARNCLGLQSKQKLRLVYLLFFIILLILSSQNIKKFISDCPLSMIMENLWYINYLNHQNLSYFLLLTHF